jgi:circadian clock protein KaiB
MKKSAPPKAPESLAPPPASPPGGADRHFHFQLYITGSSTRSLQAIANLRSLCEEHLDGRYQLEVIDLYQEPARAALGQIIASPTLIKILPKPLVRMVGNLADREHLKIKLNLTDPLGQISTPFP